MRVWVMQKILQNAFGWLSESDSIFNYLVKFRPKEKVFYQHTKAFLCRINVNVNQYRLGF